MTINLYSAEEIAALLKLELDTVYRYARRGELKGVKLGKLWRFSEEDVVEFLKRKRSARRKAGQVGRLLTDVLSEAAQADSRTSGIATGGGRLTFAEVDERSSRLAAALITRGIAPGDRVFCALPSSPEFVIACFGVWKARAIFVPEDVAIRPTNLIHILADSNPAALIIDAGIAEAVEAQESHPAGLKAVFVRDCSFNLPRLEACGLKSLEAVLENRGALEFEKPDPAAPGDVVTISYTSGSTGLPKGVMHTHDSWLASAEFTRAHASITAEDRIVVPLPLHHGLAFRQILAYMQAGGTVLLAQDVYQGLKLVRDQRPSALVLVPAATNILLDHFPSVLREADAFLRYVEIGSAALAPERLKQLRQCLPSTPVHLPYGLTEARVGFLSNGTGGLLNRITAVSPGLILDVVDDAGNPVPAGGTGEIRLKGRGLMKGYWGRPAGEIQALEETGFRTGDLGKIGPEGDVELLGRVDDMLKVGGRKVNPLEVEMALNRHPGVAQSAALGRPDPKGIYENEVHAFVVIREGYESLGEADLKNHCRAELESYKVPAHIHFRDSLPTSSVGKVLRRSLGESVTVR